MVPYDDHASKLSAGWRSSLLPKPGIPQRPASISERDLNEPISTLGDPALAHEVPCWQEKGPFLAWCRAFRSKAIRIEVQSSTPRLTQGMECRRWVNARAAQLGMRKRVGSSMRGKATSRVPPWESVDSGNAP